jgi:hypothetical protein
VFFIISYRFLVTNYYIQVLFYERPPNHPRHYQPTHTGCHVTAQLPATPRHHVGPETPLSLGKFFIVLFYCSFLLNITIYRCATGRHHQEQWSTTHRRKKARWMTKQPKISQEKRIKTGKKKGKPFLLPHALITIFTSRTTKPLVNDIEAAAGIPANLPR